MLSRMEHGCDEHSAQCSFTIRTARQGLEWVLVPELGNPQVRERFAYSYRVLYEIGATRIDILAVIHGRRLLEPVEDRCT